MRSAAVWFWMTALQVIVGLFVGNILTRRLAVLLYQLAGAFR